MEGGEFHMSSSIDERVVSMKFDNAEFQRNAQATLQSLQTLNKNLNFSGVTTGLANLTQATNSLANIEEHTGRVAHGFSIMRVAAYSAISMITRQALYAGEQLVKSFTLDPVHLGFENYETQINAVQTILANTGLKGAKGLKQVNGVLADLNTYANQTVYNFSEMAKNIGTFTAAGVKLKPAAAAIKGIANLAAMSGASSQQASSAMYQLSQALAANQVKLQDWNSVVNAGIGGKAFQEALFNTGEAMHRIKGIKMGETFDEWTKSGHTFRQSLKDGWINAKVLSTTLSGFTGDLSENALKSIGYNAAQIKHIREMGKVATEAATKIKTISQLKDALREEVGTAYAAIFKTLFGDINQAKSWLSPLHIFLENMLTNPIYAINRVLQGWSKLGGRFVFIDAMKLGFTELKRIIAPIHDAFKEIFPSTTAKTLYNMTTALHVFIENLNISDRTVKNLRRTFAGVFAILDIGWQIVKNVAHFIGDLFSQFRDSSSSGGILQVTGNLGDFFVALDKAIKKGDGLRAFFVKLEKVIQPPIHWLSTLIHYLTHFASVGTGEFNKIPNILAQIGKVLKPISDDIRKFFSGMFKNINFDNILKVLNVGLVAGMALMIKRIADHFSGKKRNSPIQKFVDTIKEPFEELTNTLKTMQQTLRAATLLEIATAVGILAASVIGLSHVDPAGLTRALTALTVMFGQLMGSLYLFNRVGGAKGLATTSAGLILFATAIRVLTSSVKALSSLSWQELAKGLAGVTVLLGALVLATRGMSGNAKGMIRAGAGLILLAEGIKILAGAVKELSALSWGEIAKGLTGVGALLLALTLFTKFADANKGGVLQGAGILLLATAIKVLAGAVDEFGKMHWENIGKGLAAISGILLAFALFSKGVGNPVSLLASGASLVMIAGAMLVLQRAIASFGKMDWENIGKGLLAMAGALGIIAIALQAMPITSILSAAALVAISVALVGIAGAMKIMGGMSWSEIAKGLVELAGALTIIAVATDAMLTALPGAAAILVVAAALAILVPELAIMGSMSWEGIAKGMVVLAGAFTIIGLAGLLLTPVIPSLLGLAGSVALLGVGIAAIGAGVFLFAAGLTAIATAGAAAASAIAAIVGTVVGLLPTIAVALGKTMVALADAIAKAAPSIFRTAVVLLDQFLKAIDRESPKIIRTFGDLILHLLEAIDHYGPRIVNTMVDILIKLMGAITNRMPELATAGAALIVSFLAGIAKHVNQIITAGTNIIISVIKGIGKAATDIATAALQTILAFIKGLDDAINTYEPQIIAAGEKLAADVIKGLVIGLAKSPISLGKLGFHLGKSIYKGAAKAVGAKSPATEFIKLGQYIDQGLAIGLTQGKDSVMAAWGTTHDLLHTAISSSADDIKKYTDRLDTLEKAHKKNPKAIRETTQALAEAHREHIFSIAALDDLNKKQAKHYASLKSLGAEYDDLKTKIDDANQALQDAIKTRDDFNQQVKDQYSAVPDAGHDVTVALQDTASQITSTTVDQTKTVSALQDYTDKLQYQVNDTVKFAQVVQQLKDMGLNDAMYQKLISEGPTSLQFAEELLAGGAEAVANIDGLSDQLSTAASALGTKASSNLYQAGVDAAQGIVNGLNSKRSKSWPRWRRSLMLW
jgi:tape measure domain-containing protein